MDFDPDVPGIHHHLRLCRRRMCYVNEQMLPEIAMDVDGFAEAPAGGWRRLPRRARDQSLPQSDLLKWPLDHLG